MSKTNPPLRLTQTPPSRVLVLGHGSLGLALTQGVLAAESCELVGVFPWSSRPKGRDFLDAHEKRLLQCIRQHRIPHLRCAGVNSFAFTQYLEQLAPDIVLVGSWGEILKPHLLQIEKITFINCHPSKLPAYRGANPYAAAIQANEQEAGVSFHLITETIDTGPILMQKTLPIDPKDTGGSLREKSALVAQELTTQLLQQLNRPEGLMPQIQNESQQSYCPPLKLEDGRIQWNREPLEIYNQVRSLQPWLDCFTFIEGQTIFTIQQAHVAPSPSPCLFQAGTVVGFWEGCLWVASRNAHQLIGLSRFRLGTPFFFLPQAVSRWIAKKAFRPGLRLY